jgi:hypothetical protein
MDVEADFQTDRPCGNCGYNLRGLPVGQPCPECGSIGGINCDDETIPFDERRSIVGFIETVILVAFQPGAFGRLVWSPVRFELKSARLFRRIAVLIALGSLCAVAAVITSRAVGPWAAVGAIPLSGAAFLVWLNSVSLDPIAFIRGTASPVVRRAEIVAHYTSAMLVLTPLHLPLLVLTSPWVTGPKDWPLAAGAHLLAVFLQLVIGARATASMFHELVEATRSRALGFTLARTLNAVGSALPVLIGTPALAGALARKWLGG